MIPSDYTIYSSEADFLIFDMPYSAKRLLNDSLLRTLDGYASCKTGAILSGTGNILLARIESAASAALVTISSIIISCSIFITPFFLVPTITLNLASRLPGISSYKNVQKFTQNTSDIIRRAIRVHLISVPVIFLFLIGCTVNLFLPGVLRPQNALFRAVHWMVDDYGPLKTIRAVVPGRTSVTGRKSKLSMLEGVEEYLRALSHQNYLKEEKVSYLTHHYSYSSRL